MSNEDDVLEGFTFKPEDNEIPENIKDDPQKLLAFSDSYFNN